MEKRNMKFMVDSVAERLNVSKLSAKQSIEAFLGVIEEELAKGNKVQLLGHMSFDVKERKERKGRNPQNGEEITIPASKVLHVTAMAELKRKLNP